MNDSCRYCTPYGVYGGVDDMSSNEYLSAELDGNQLRIEILYEREDDWIGHPTGAVEGFINIKYCPMCGKPLGGN